MRTLYQQPDSMKEEWAWQTNTITADDGTEQRIMLCPYPKRTMTETLNTDTLDDTRDLITTQLVGTADNYLVPFWQAAVLLKAHAAPGTSALVFTTMRSDVRSGSPALLVSRSGQREQVLVEAITETGCTVADPLVNDWSIGAKLIPLWEMYSTGQMQINRRNSNLVSSVAITLSDANFMVPFVDEFAQVELELFAGLPVLPYNATGTEFTTGVDNGATWDDYGGVVESRNRWKHAQLVFPRTFLVQRVLEPEVWNWWRSFADYCKGSVNPFFIPTFRPDFALTTPPAPNGTTLTFTGRDYTDHFFPLVPFKQLAIYSELGVQYVTVTAAIVTAGNSVVTFTPALPNVAGWANDQLVSLLLKARIADDLVSCDHSDLHTLLSINIRTVDA